MRLYLIPLESIFTKSSVLHDGAVVVFEGRIVQRVVRFPTNKNIQPDHLGIRHRAVGVSERRTQFV